LGPHADSPCRSDLVPPPLGPGQHGGRSAESRRHPLRNRPRITGTVKLRLPRNLSPRQAVIRRSPRTLHRSRQATTGEFAEDRASSSGLCCDYRLRGWVAEPTPDLERRIAGASGRAIGCQRQNKLSRSAGAVKATLAKIGTASPQNPTSWATRAAVFVVVRRLHRLRFDHNAHWPRPGNPVWSRRYPAAVGVEGGPGAPPLALVKTRRGQVVKVSFYGPSRVGGRKSHCLISGGKLAVVGSRRATVHEVRRDYVTGSRVGRPFDDKIVR